MMVAENTRLKDTILKQYTAPSKACTTSTITGETIKYSDYSKPILRQSDELDLGVSAHATLLRALRTDSIT